MNKSLRIGRYAESFLTTDPPGAYRTIFLFHTRTHELNPF
jgi:hypothetical protein